MHIRFALFTILVVLISISARSQHRVEVIVPSAAAEADYIWRTLRDIPFFEQHGYQVSLPGGPLMDKLKEKAKAGKLADEDYDRLVQFVADHVYRPEDYAAGAEKIRQQLALLDTMIHQLNPTSYPWTFTTFDTYRVTLTLYGPGGSYDPEEGSILIYTTPTGQVKNYDDPANTIIHEVVHIGLEQAIMVTLQVPHPLKERIVDTFVSLHFGRYLPEYRIQNLGDTRSDPYLKSPADFSRLDQIVARLLKQQ